MICLPVIHQPTSDDCIAGMVKLWDQTLVIDNSPDGFAARYPCEVVARPQNAGVAASWNIGRRRTLERGDPYLVILSAATHFRDEGASLLEILDDNTDWRGFQTQEGWHCIALSSKLLAEIGTFDENFWPAYFEDTDYLWRMQLSGHWHPTQTPMPQRHIEAGRVQDAHGMLLAGVVAHFGALSHYYVRKWGGGPGEETNDLAFGDQDPSWWPACG